jgi:tRNA A58 N-methylase Trm61
MNSINSLEPLASHKPHRYPWWLAFVLTSPVRRLIEDPAIVLGDFVRPGHTVLELGPANGYYSVPIARTLGATGKLIAVDVQPQMLRMLSRRLKGKELDRCLVTRLSEHVETDLGELANAVDRVVAINVIHELPKPRETLFALAETLREDGQMLLVEPRGHVSKSLYEAELAWAREAGLELVAAPDMPNPGRMRTQLRKPTSS